MVDEPGSHRRWEGTRFSARLRLTAFATLITTLVLSVTAGFLLLGYRHTLIGNAQDEIRKAATVVSARANAPGLTTPFVSNRSFTESVQILDAQNRVVDGDLKSRNVPPIATLAPGQDETRLTLIDPDARAVHTLYVVALAVDTSAGRRTVVVADSLDPVDTRIREAARSAVITGTIFLVLASWMYWVIIGRTLRPVERLRRRVAEITSSGDLRHRVPQVRGHDEVGKLAGTLNGMLAALESSAGVQRQFVADAAHELRTPLAGMTALLEVAAAHPDAINQYSLVARLHGASQHLNRLVNDLLTLAVLDAGAPVRQQPLDLTGVVQDGLRHVDRQQIQVLEPTSGRTTVLGNDTQLTRVVINLVENAVRHARTTVSVDLRATRTDVLLSVADDGPGVPAKDRDRIWQRFVRLDGDRGRARGGTGIGLALVKEIVTAHLGEVWVDDASPGPGALFIVRLPLLSSPSRSARQRPIRPPTSKVD